MTDILPPAGWPNVRQLETNEFASGGANGNMNEQAKSLAARSELLKQYVALPYESKTSGYALNERVQLATGDIVRSTIASNVNNPNENMTGWVIPYLVKSSNLDDVPDKATARNNLDVYSQTEVDTAISNATPTIPSATETTAGKAKIATTAIARAGVNDTDFLTAKKLRDALNATGDAPVSACRAWVCFNAKTTPPTMLSSFNVSSVTKASTGNYEVFYTHEMPSNNYTFVLSLGNIANSVASTNAASIRSIGTPTSKSIRLVSGNHFYNSQPEYFDPDFVSVVIF